MTNEGSCDWKRTACSVPGVRSAGALSVATVPRERAARERQTRVRFLVVVAVVVIVIVLIIVHNADQGEQAAFNAGAAWAKSEMAAGYGATDPQDPDPCDDLRAVAVASSGYKLSSWLSGCESVSGG